MPRIEVHHLQDLAERTTGKTQLGELIRRLIYASVARCQPNLHFLAGETNGYAGWDGWVEVSFEEHGAVQRHRSVWELSTDRDPKEKFKRDYRSARSKALPNGWAKADVIYVAMTLRSVTPKALASIKKQLIQEDGNPWAGIVLLAADDTVQWLEKVPSVEDWAAAEFEIGSGRFGRPLENWFSSWSNQTTPDVTERLLTSGRDISPLLAAFRLNGDPVTTLQCDSVEEAVALVYCAAKSLSATDARLVLSSTLVVTDEVLADRLADQPKPPLGLPTVVLTPPATRHKNRLAQAGYRVIQALGRIEDSTGVLHFERASVHEFASALEESMGIPAAEAETQARAAGSSVSIWHIRNAFRSSSQPSLPEWAGIDGIDAVVAAVFAGSWREQSSADMAVLAELANMDEARLAGSLAPFAACTTPLVEHIGSNRMVIAPTAAFEFICRRITKHHIGRLTNACTSVFGAVLPAVNERWHDQPPEFSSRDLSEEISNGLRDGLAETLLRIAVLGAPLVSSGALASYSSGQGYVDQLVRSLPGLNQDPRLLASLDRQLPVLIEAAPIPFLDALDTLLQGAADQLSIMLTDEPGIFGRSFHTGLLWGLESLAWSPEYLPRVAELLAALDQIDTGGKISNRPFQSLCEIFLPWHPGTSCDPQQRVEILRNVNNRFPSVGWKLLVELLPGKRRTSTLTHRPKWRNLGQVNRRTIQRAEVFDAYELNIELTLSLAERNVEKLTDLVELYPHLAPHHKSKLESALRLASQLRPPSETAQRLWGRLHRLCRRHSSFPDAGWALPQTELQRLQEIADGLVVEDPVLKHRWLFDDQLPDLGEREKSYEARSEAVHALRHLALGEVLTSRGWPGINQLITVVNYSYIVGNEVGLLDCEDIDVLRAMGSWQTDASSSMWMAFRSTSSSRATKRGLSWTNAVLTYAREHTWSSLAVAMTFVDYPDCRQTYEIVQQLRGEEQREYWSRRFGFLRGADDDVEAFGLAVEAFMKHGRALDLIDQNWGDLSKLGHQVVFKVIDAFIAQLADTTKVASLTSIDHDLQHVFDWLRKQPEVRVEELARREYALLPLLTSYGTGDSDLSLHKLMREQPEFFAEVVCHLYKPAGGESESQNADHDVAKMRAHAAFELLESWHTPPGVRETIVDGELLAAWVDAARAMLKSLDRADIGDQTIGKLLRYLPSDLTDGAYPPQALRELLERWRSDRLEDGIEIESFNSRGVTSRALFDGGRQERGLATQWRTDASRIGSKWPRAKALCLRIADMWDRQADAEDIDARKDRARQSR